MNGLIELPLSYRDIVYMTCIVHIVDYIDTFVNSYYQNKWTCVTLLKLVFIQYSSIQISLSVSKGFIFFKRCSKTHYKCCVSQQRELIFTVYSTMSNFPDSCRILIMIQLIAMCWPHFQAISFAVSSVITCPVHHCHNLPICVISCMNSITYRSPWTL